MIELVVFLGNPGSDYMMNRHNAGSLMAEVLNQKINLVWKDKFKGRWASLDKSDLKSLSSEEPFDDALPPAKVPPVKVKPEKIQLLVPQTFMNVSGASVLSAASFFKLPPEKILVIHDELELDPGVISLKFSGGLGGHNGLRSIKEKLGSADFWRMRIGIGRPDDRLPGQGGPQGSGKGIADWVLSDFSRPEWENLQPCLDAGVSLLGGVLCRGPEAYLPEWRKKKIIVESA